jgi:hypothetical protein
VFINFIAKCVGCSVFFLKKYSERLENKIYHLHVYIKDLGHLLTHSSLTHPDVSSVVFLGYSCLLGCSFLSIWIICYLTFDLRVLSIFTLNPVLCPKLGLYLIPLQYLYLFCHLFKCIQSMRPIGSYGYINRYQIK